MICLAKVVGSAVCTTRQGRCAPFALQLALTNASGPVPSHILILEFPVDIFNFLYDHHESLLF
jgi:hypothetical protein